MANPFTIALGKLAQAAARLKGGGGSAFPGLVVEKLEPNFAVGPLENLPLGVVVISGTNGKTTTTKIVTELLEAQGLKVFTNSTGSNFMRGVIASMLSQMTLTGKLDADIAVLELDEAHAVHFVRKVAPRFSLLLNVMRDQLDRFGEIDHTADLLAIIARHTTEAVVINREDNRLARFTDRKESIESTATFLWYGLSPALVARFPQDDELYAKGDEGDGSTGTGDGSETHRAGTQGYTGTQRDGAQPIVTLESLEKSTATYTIEGKAYQVQLALKGIYNAYNAAAALALVRTILGDAAHDGRLVKQLTTVTGAFGRGESFTVDGREFEMLLVKNPGGFRLALESFDPGGHDTMIAINDEYADGRDMSWLYDVDFTGLAQTGVKMVSGTRAYDMALRLAYDEVGYHMVDTQLEQALDVFIRSTTRPLRLYCTYTAMLRCRKHLGGYTTVRKVE